jgi:RimJ/RimL family protein N-acetyltransferase
VASRIGARLCTSERAVRLGPLLDVMTVDVVERDLNKPLPALKPIAGAQMRRVSPGQSEGWREFLPRDQWEIAEGCLADGHQAYFVMLDGDLAARILVSRTSYRGTRFGLHIRLAPDEAYLHGAEVYMPYRRRGVGAAVVAAVLSDLRADPTLKRVYGWIDRDNREQQALLRIVFGFTQVQTVKRALLLSRVTWQVAGSDHPRFGPVSRFGWHSGARRP